MTGAIDRINFCTACNEPVPQHLRDCVICQGFVGFPNVRAAQSRVEVSALESRVETAKVSSRARGTYSILQGFGDAVATSKAVIGCNLPALLRWASTDRNLYVSFHKQLGSGERLPEDNIYDKFRAPVDGVLFPHYSENIIFAALSIDGTGVKYFGNYSVELKESAIAQRTSVFEENSFTFCTTRHKLRIGSPIPPGYRSIWDHRGKIAMAKMHGGLDDKTTEQHFQKILINNSSGSSCDYIEAHIFGPIHTHAIARVVFPKKTNRPDAMIEKVIQNSLKKLNIPFVRES